MDQRSIANSMQTFSPRQSIDGQPAPQKQALRSVQRTASWSDPAAFERAIQAMQQPMFVRLAEFAQAQVNPFYCGIATLASIVNSVLRLNPESRVARFVDARLKVNASGFASTGFPVVSQESILCERTDSIKCRTAITASNVGPKDPGLSLVELEALFAHYDFDCQRVTPLLKGWSAMFREGLRRANAEPGTFVVANFLGHSIDKPIGGHFSPIGAWDPDTDSVLVLDVARHKTGWYWVSVEDLLVAMAQADNGRPRGFLLVRAGGVA